MSKKTWGLAFVMCFAVLTGVTLSVARTAKQPEAADAARAARERHGAKVRAIDAMHSGDHATARDYFVSLVTNPQTLLDPVEGRRLLAMSHRFAGEAGDALQELEAAEDALIANPEIEARYPGIGAAITMDRAQVLAFGRQDLAAALILYDQVAGSESGASIRDDRIARQNAAVLCASMGQFPEACRRLNELLASSFASNIPADEVRSLRSSQVSWYASQGNLEEATRRGLELWNANLDIADPRLADMAVTIAQWYPVPDACDARCALLLSVLEKIDAVRASPTEPSDLELADSVESQVLDAIADSADCQNAALIQQAVIRGRR